MYAEIIKLRRTPFFWCHLLFPVAGAVVFGYYFTSYVTQSETNRFRLILEITATIFPILASVMTGIVVAPEEATGFYTILSEEKRGRAILTKLLFLWGMGAGVAYFLIICVLSIAMEPDFEPVSNSSITTLLICLGSGMLGGMLG